MVPNCDPLRLSGEVEARHESSSCIGDGNGLAHVNRAEPNVHWKKERGKESMREQSQYPWSCQNGKFTGARSSDLHFSVAKKIAARDRARE